MTSNCEIAVYFKDQGIAHLFSALLGAVGQNGVAVSDLSMVSGDALVITEPLFYPLLNENQKQRCLLVGPADSMRNIQANCIEQPLTEEKIDAALELFLSGAR